MTPDAVLIFAAGLGTRMGALTADRSKPLIEVAGKALIDHALDLVQEAGVTRIVVNTHYKPEMLRTHLAGRGVALSDESDRLLETGGGLRRAMPLLGPDPVFTMNSDAVWRGQNPVSILAAAWNPAQMDALLLLVPPDNAIGHPGKGDFTMDDQGGLTRGRGLVYSGVQIIRTDRLDTVPEKVFSLNLVWDDMIARGRLFGLRYDGQWCDVGQPESLPLAEALARKADV